MAIICQEITAVTKSSWKLRIRLELFETSPGFWLGFHIDTSNGVKKLETGRWWFWIALKGYYLNLCNAYSSSMGQWLKGLLGRIMVGNYQA